MGVKLSKFFGRNDTQQMEIYIQHMINKFKNIISEKSLFLNPVDDYIQSFKEGMRIINEIMFTDIMVLYVLRSAKPCIYVNKHISDKYEQINSLPYALWIDNYTQNVNILQDGTRVLYILLNSHDLENISVNSINYMFAEIILLCPQHIPNNGSDVLTKNVRLYNYLAEMPPSYKYITNKSS